MRPTHPLRSAAIVLVTAATLSVGLTVATATAKPNGKSCHSFIYAKNVKVTGTGCSQAEEALRKGRFAGPTNSKFGTPGWKCSGAGKRPNARYTCTKAKATLRFTA
jgi:hypothetical protein